MRGFLVGVHERDGSLVEHHIMLLSARSLLLRLELEPIVPAFLISCRSCPMSVPTPRTESPCYLLMPKLLMITDIRYASRIFYKAPDFEILVP